MSKRIRIAFLNLKKVTKQKEVVIRNILLAILSCLLIVTLTLFSQSQEKTREKTLELEQTINKLQSQLLDLKIAGENLSQELLKFQGSEAHKTVSLIEETIDAYQAAERKISESEGQAVDVEKPQEKLAVALQLIIEKQYDQARSQLNEINSELDQLLAVKLEEQEEVGELSTTTPRSAAALPGEGYSRITIATNRGNFLIDLVKIDLNNARVITDTGDDDDCSDNCLVKPLAQYIAENGGFAGINGSYFCPADYASCAGKVNSFDFAVFNSRHRRWINATTLFWSGRTMAAFDGSSNPYFFPEANRFAGGPDLRAAIVNYPSLVSNGQNVLGEGEFLNDYLRLTKGTRSGIGAKGKMIYLVVARSASVPDLAEIFISLGVDHAMNLDGGGSSALFYNGSYVAGPGRNIPNALIFAR